MVCMKEQDLLTFPGVTYFGLSHIVLPPKLLSKILIGFKTNLGPKQMNGVY